MQYFLACCISFYFGNPFSFFPQASDVGETHSFFPGTVHVVSCRLSSRVILSMGEKGASSHKQSETQMRL
jgi:hypothetical protein